MFDKVKDSGQREDFDTGARRDVRSGKGRFDLIPTWPLRQLAIHYENGAKKYGEGNWEKGIPLARYLDSAFRHLVSILEGRKDEDHVSAAIWNLMSYSATLRWIEQGILPRELDDLNHASADEEQDDLVECLKHMFSKKENGKHQFSPENRGPDNPAKSKCSKTPELVSGGTCAICGFSPQYRLLVRVCDREDLTFCREHYPVELAMQHGFPKELEPKDEPAPVDEDQA